MLFQLFLYKNFISHEHCIFEESNFFGRFYQGSAWDQSGAFMPFFNRNFLMFSNLVHYLFRWLNSSCFYLFWICTLFSLFWTQRCSELLFSDTWWWILEFLVGSHQSWEIKLIQMVLRRYLTKTHLPASLSFLGFIVNTLGLSKSKNYIGNFILQLLLRWLLGRWEFCSFSILIYLFSVLSTVHLLKYGLLFGHLVWFQFLLCFE